MSTQSLQAICKLRNLSQSDLARMAGVSRQAVSLWLKAPSGSELVMRTSHLRQLAGSLELRADELLQPLPILDDPEASRRLEASLLWDRLYPTLLDFSVALTRGQPPALARLVQVFGMYKGAKIAGRKIWERFPDYKRYIRPVRREQLEGIWLLRQRLSSG